MPKTAFEPRGCGIVIHAAGAPLCRQDSLKKPVPACSVGSAGAPARRRRWKRVNSNRMTKQQLIEKVAANTAVGKAEAEAAVDSVLAVITEALRSNERVDLRGFGSFVVKDKKERQGRNPRTGETITIAAKRDASFKPSKELTEKLAKIESGSQPDKAL